jgi:hypothetical protein
LVALALFVSNASLAQSNSAQCACDCDGNGVVTIDEMVAGVNIALGKTDMDDCEAADPQSDGNVSVQELVMGVSALINGCFCQSESNTFSSTWEGIQKTIFERHGCTEQICHGSGAQGELDLRPDVAYANLIDVVSSQSTDDRVEPGEADRSLLWLKIAAKTDPDQIPPGKQVPGSPMPQLGDALSTDELELLRLWIYNGAPETGTVSGTEDLLGACLPPPDPIVIKPLDPPAAGEGVQFVMPPWDLEARSEYELCFATYYDISDQVPPQYLTPDGKFFYFNAQELRQDPQSHHLILNRYNGSTEDVHDPAFGTWTCRGGDTPGQECEPTDLESCGSGICTSKMEQTFACIGFGPGSGLNRQQIGGAQQAQSFTEFYPGVFAAIPVKGILIWNPHAFNVTDKDHTMNGRLNYYFADDREFPVNSIFTVGSIFDPDGVPPFTKQTICRDYTLDRYARLYSLSSHTHKHGQYFTIEHPDGTLIYENFLYNDPLNATFDPPLEFDSANDADRTLRYCSLYNNGELPDGSPDVDLVTRASRVPPNAPLFSRCTPVACVEGQVGAACSKDTDCDTSPGANDGWCDACPIKGGESTENEMFLLIGQYFIDPPN